MIGQTLSGKACSILHRQRCRSSCWKRTALFPLLKTRRTNVRFSLREISRKKFPSRPQIKFKSSCVRYIRGEDVQLLFANCLFISNQLIFFCYKVAKQNIMPTLVQIPNSSAQNVSDASETILLDESTVFVDELDHGVSNDTEINAKRKASTNEGINKQGEEDDENHESASDLSRKRLQHPP